MRMLLGKSTVFGIFVLTVYASLINPTTNKTDEAIATAMFSALFLVWGLLSAFLYSRVDEEWKKTQTAVLQNDFETFRVEAPKRIPETFIVLYRIIAALTIISMGAFHVQNPITFALFFLVPFAVGFVYYVIQDLDDPYNGVVNVDGIPKEWLDKVTGKTGGK